MSQSYQPPNGLNATCICLACSYHSCCYILHSEEYSQSLDEAETNMAEAKTGLSKSNIILCEQSIKSGVDFNTAFNAFRKVHDFEIFDFALNEDARIGISGGVNFANRTDKSI